MQNKESIKKIFTLKKQERFKSRKGIDILFKQGKSFSSFPIRVLYATPDKVIIHLLAGFAVSTKNFKKAVERNRIKRLMREAYRLQKIDLSNKLKFKNKFLSIFFIYTGKKIPEYKDVYDKMNIILKNLENITDEMAAQNA